MDIYKFINSRDIAEHLKSIDYEFSSLECAFLIYQSQNTTLRQRHNAWQEIIDTMPDCSIEKRLNAVPQESLHRFLEKYMSIENRLILKFYEDEENCAYTYKFYCEGDDDWCHNGREMFSTFDKCFEAFSDDMKFSPLFAKFEKIYIDGSGKSITLQMLPSKEIIHVDEFRMFDIHSEEDDIICCGFDGLWFDFPTPFKKGDILIEARGGYKLPRCFDGAFVLKFLCIEKDKVYARLKKNGDISDMTAHGYFVNEENCCVYYECMHKYLNCEYVKEESLKDEQRLLIAISHFMKGDIDIEMLLGAHRIMLNKVNCKSSNYIKEWFKYVGIELDNPPNNDENDSLKKFL